MEITRGNYLDGKVSFSEYYGHLAKLCGIAFSRDDFFKGYSFKKCLEEDEHLNNIPLKLWDNLAGSRMCYPVARKLMEIDPCFGSLSDYVCMYKEAAKRFVKGE